MAKSILPPVMPTPLTKPAESANHSAVNTEPEQLPPEELVVSQLRHLVATVKLFGVIALAFVLVMCLVALLKLDGQQAHAQGTPAPQSMEPVYRASTETPLQLVNQVMAEQTQNVRASALAANAGWRVADGRRQYCLENGSLAVGVVAIDGVNVTFDNEGNWLSSRLDVPYISQLPDMPSGCEVVSVTMMLNHAGVAVSKEELAAGLPYAGDPSQGFTGNLYSAGGYGLGGIVWPPALLGLVESHQGSAVDLTGESWEVVRGFIDAGKPVCVWFSSNGLDHTVVLTGYSDSTVWVNDPLANKDVELNLDTFLSFWRQNSYRALSY
ncbi:MAG: C39 family peptidase [Coriobacteriales bacterium]|nr:C39 family peptidase [Coriobacteriales bacterium]